MLIVDTPCLVNNIFATGIGEGLSRGGAWLVLLLLLLDAHHELVVAVLLSPLKVLVIVLRQLVCKIWIIHQLHQVRAFRGRFLCRHHTSLGYRLLF